MTFSIVARDPRTGAFGVATATRMPFVGALVPHASAAGAVATQGDTNPFYGIDGLALLAAGRSAAEVVATVTGDDDRPDIRQCLVIGRAGPPAAWTGPATLAQSGHVIGKDFAAAGNMLGNEHVVEAMAVSFRANAEAGLPEALMAALLAGERAGGDYRGISSAALKTHTGQAYAAIDIRVDLSENPLEDLAALLRICRIGEYAEFMAGRLKR